MTESTVVTKMFPVYAVGTPGKPWNDQQRQEWLSRQVKIRDYFGDLLSHFMRIPFLDIFQYGEVDYRDRVSTISGPAALYPLFAGRSLSWDEKKPLIIVSCGNHGYEITHTGLLFFLRNFYQKECEGKSANFLFLFCMCPWGFEHDHRWTPNAIDPNRQFVNDDEGGCEAVEASLAMKCINDQIKRTSGILAHFDLHETTDTDNFIFTPTKIARDGLENTTMDEIPQGWCSVACKHNHQIEFQKAIIEEVEKVTPIAPGDSKNEILGHKLDGKGIVPVDGRKMRMCSAFTNAPYSVTSEVYPDLKGCCREECDRAQAACVRAGVRYVLANPLLPL